MTGNLQSPSMKDYDVVVIGGAIMGASVAWYLTENPDLMVTFWSSSGI